MKKDRPKLKIGNILFNILTIATVIVVGFVIFNVANGATGYAVTSDSMANTLKRGDIVFVKPIDTKKIEVGDVVTVDLQETRVYFTHRVVKINGEDKTITTKGDNNNENDPMDTPIDRVVGKMWYSVPLLGYFSIIFNGANQTKILIIIAIVAISLIAVNTVISALNKKKKNGGVGDE